MKKTNLILWGTSVFLAIAAAVLRTLALTSGYDFETGYFLPGILPTLMHLFLTLSCLGLAVAVFFCRKSVPDGIPAFESAGISCVFASALFGFVFLLAFLSYFRSASLGTASAIGLIQMLLCLPAAAAFFLRTAQRKINLKKLGDLRALLMLCGSFWFMLTIIGFYFNRALPTNSPTKSLAYLTMTAVMLTLVYEGHLFIGRRQAPILFALSMITTVLCAAYAIPNLICSRLAGGPLLISSLYDIMVLAAGIYTAVCSFSLPASLPADE